MSITHYTAVAVVFLNAAFLFCCNQSNPLNEVEQLVQQQKFDQALAKLEGILAREPENKKAQLLKINTAMLQESNTCRDNRPESLTVAMPPTGAGIKNASAPVKNGAGFSIMSLCNEKSDGNVNDISRKLEN